MPKVVKCGRSEPVSVERAVEALRNNPVICRKQFTLDLSYIAQRSEQLFTL